jgi:hypothetical protein
MEKKSRKNTYVSKVDIKTTKGRKLLQKELNSIKSELLGDFKRLFQKRVLRKRVDKK